MRTRFPPSPTGFLHVGGLRTALFSFIVARQTKGEFVLRIEDTDQARSVEGAIENILRTLHWAGMHPDEGVMLKGENVVQEGSRGPYVQSERLHLYKEYAEKLWEDGHAYPCFCTAQRLEKMREEQQAAKRPPMYDRHCLSLSREEAKKKIDAGEKYVLRMKIPRERTITFSDDVRGDVTFKGETIDDQVLLKSDGFPTYHLAHVVDDHLMDIDIVIRGEEWLSSLPKHILLFEMLGWQPMRYAHVPLLLNRDKSKLSKRQGDVAVEDFISKGYLPEAMLNFLVLLGWNPGTTQELFTLDDLIGQFSLERVQKSGAIFDLEKLEWIQGQWMRKIDPMDFAKRIQPLVAEKFPAAAKDTDFGKKAALIQERITFFKEASDLMSFFYEEPKVSAELLTNKKMKVTAEDLPKILQFLTETLSEVSDWTNESLKATLLAAAQKYGYKNSQLLWPLRAAITGRDYSPGAFEVAAMLGKEETLARLKRVL